MHKKVLLWLIGAAIVMIAGSGMAIYSSPRNLYPTYQSVKQFGPLRLGDEMPVGGPGDYTFAPLHRIPISKFYVVIVHGGPWCSLDHCGNDGALVGTMGGWLQTEKPSVFPDVTTLTGLDLEENKDVHSLVIVGNQSGKIAGIYPRHGLKDVLPILRLHPDLANFGMLDGVQEFGALKVGHPAPLRPGDSLARFGDTLARYGITHIPIGRKFYLFSVQKRKYDTVGGQMPHDNGHPRENKYRCFLSGCRYPEPDPPHDFLFADVEELRGWFFSNEEDNAELPQLFGTSREAALAGTSSLVVLTDAHGVIRALHPGKTLSDTLTILSQHTELADVRALYRSPAE